MFFARPGVFTVSTGLLVFVLVASAAPSADNKMLVHLSNNQNAPEALHFKQSKNLSAVAQRMLSDPETKGLLQDLIEILHLLGFTDEDIAQV